MESEIVEIVGDFLVCIGDVEEFCIRRSEIVSVVLELVDKGKFKEKPAHDYYEAKLYTKSLKHSHNVYISDAGKDKFMRMLLGIGDGEEKGISAIDLK